MTYCSKIGHSLSAEEFNALFLLISRASLLRCCSYFRCLTSCSDLIELINSFNRQIWSSRLLFSFYTSSSSSFKDYLLSSGSTVKETTFDSEHRVLAYVALLSYSINICWSKITRLLESVISFYKLMFSSLIISTLLFFLGVKLALLRKFLLAFCSSTSFIYNLCFNSSFYWLILSKACFNRALWLIPALNFFFSSSASN